ncbi:MAG: hypothetical protein M3Y21_01335 [Candidatus Eremiobacteraeota bacterium]|nr:hypothetical protein [Candidatus Eremiobacteraeota bacterium]
MYSGVSLAVFVAQLLLYFYGHFKHGDILGLLLIAPILVTLVNAGVGSDLCGEQIATYQLFERVLERIWAVIIIDLIVSSLLGAGIAAIGTGDGLEIVLGLAITLMSGTLLFADVYASTEPKPSMLTILPFSLMRSSALAWQNGNIVRICYLIGLQAVFILLTGLLLTLLKQHHMANIEFWANVPISTALTGPFAALFTVVYYDCLARERIALEERR